MATAKINYLVAIDISKYLQGLTIWVIWTLIQYKREMLAWCEWGSDKGP